MKYCTKCGNSVDDNAIFCVRCGARQGDGAGLSAPFTNPYVSNTRPTYTAEDLKPSLPIAIVSFLFNILGLIFWAVWRESKPGRATSAAKGALCSLAFGSPVIGVIFWAVFRRSYPEYSKVCLVGGIVGFFFNLVVVIVTVVLTLAGVITPEMLDAYYSYGYLAYFSLLSI